MTMLIKHATIINANGRQQANILIEHGRIQQIGHMISDADVVIDGTGQYIMPGFIDMHIHGSVKCDAMDATDETLHNMARSLVKEGTTGFLPTTMTQSDAQIERALTQLGQFTSHSEEAEMLGIHLEGPFVSPKRAGAQPLAYIKPFDRLLFDKWQALSQYRIKEITMAPEEATVEDIQHLVAQQVIVSIGHADATFEQMTEAVAAGASQGTHLYNQMRPFHHRDPGVVGGALLLDALKAEIIVDFIHAHRDAVKFAYRMKGASGIILITDAMRAKGMAYGDYDLGGQTVHVTEAGAHLDNGALAGSVLTMDQAVRNMYEATGCSLEELVQMSSFNAAQQLGLASKGCIRIGADADIVLMNEALVVQKTIKRGQIVYDATQ